jgi:hypothetical protein
MGILGRIGDSLESFALSIALRRKVGSVSATRASSVLQDLRSRADSKDNVKVSAVTPHAFPKLE